MTSPSEILNRAADLIRDTAAATKDGPWRNHDTWLDAGRYTATVLAGEGNKTQLVAWLPSFESDPADGEGQFRKAWDTARWIALMSPAVAEHLESLFRVSSVFWQIAERKSRDAIGSPESARDYTSLTDIGVLDLAQFLFTETQLERRD